MKRRSFIRAVGATLGLAVIGNKVDAIPVEDPLVITDFDTNTDTALKAWWTVENSPTSYYDFDTGNAGRSASVQLNENEVIVFEDLTDNGYHLKRRV